MNEFKIKFEDNRVSLSFPLRKLDKGSIFDFEGDIFIKSDENFSVNENEEMDIVYSCVNLESGEEVTIDASERVLPIKTRLIIER